MIQIYPTTGADGDLLVSSPQTYSPSYGNFSGTVGSASLTTTANFPLPNGTLIFLTQARGTGTGVGEFAYVKSGTGTTSLTLNTPLKNSYSNGGNNVAMWTQWRNYGNVNVNTPFYAQMWNGSVGGLLGFNCANFYVNAGSQIIGDGRGYVGGQGGNNAWAGEGTAGPSVVQRGNNGNGGGGAISATGDGGGGGENAGGATNGTGSNAGNAGVAVNNPGGFYLIMGGGAGGGAALSPNGGGQGGTGGAIIFICANNIVLNASITSNGNNNVPSAGQEGRGGGAAGGTIMLAGKNINIGTNLLTTFGGVGNQGGTGHNGGNGGVGQIFVQGCSVTGTVAANAGNYTMAQGGFPFCQSYLNLVF